MWKFYKGNISGPHYLYIAFLLLMKLKYSSFLSIYYNMENVMKNGIIYFVMKFGTAEF